MHTDHPRYIQFYPTLRCDLSCATCFNRGIPDSGDISINNYDKIAAVLADNGIGEIDILGGEPTLHDGLESILEINVERSIMTSVSTNGRDVPLLGRITSRFPKEKVRLGISLYENTLSPELNDFIIAYRPVIKSISTKSAYINKIAKGYLGIDDLEQYLIYMDVLDKDDLSLSLPFYEYLNMLNVKKEEYKNIDGVYCPGFIADVKKYPELYDVRCPAGTTKLSIMPDGKVYPCYLLARENKYILGNLLEDSFRDIWNNSTLDHFRNFSGNACERESCHLLSRCHGGCPAISLMVYGSITAPDPRCVPLI